MRQKSVPDARRSLVVVGSQAGAWEPDGRSTASTYQAEHRHLVRALVRPALIDGGFDPLKDLVRRAHAVDHREDAFEAVIIQERRGLLMINFHAVGDRQWVIVSPSLFRRAAQHAID